MRTGLRLLLVAASAVACTLAFSAGALAAEQTLTFRSKPIAMQPYEVTQGVQLADSPKVDGYVVGMSADAVDAAGNVEPPSHVMLHHVVFGRSGQPDYTCGGFYGIAAERFYAAGEEREQLALPTGYGYANRGADRWGLLYMLMNHRNRAETVYVQYTVSYVTGEELTPVRPVWLDIHNCSVDPVFDVPGTGRPSAEYSRSWDFPLADGGRLVAGLGHLHGGGLRLELSDATCGTSLFTSLPTWGGAELQPVMHEPGPSHMSAFASAAGIPVAAGDTLRLTAVYDNSRPHTRVMGIMMVYLAPAPVAGCQAVPELDPDPLSQPGPPPVTILLLLKQPAGPVAKDVKRAWVGDYLFDAQRVSIRRGTTFTWRFVGAVPHNVTLATGPVGFSSPSLKGGAAFSYRFTEPGGYRLFCSLHPTRMTQIVTVR